jgi:hypothetical protein
MTMFRQVVALVVLTRICASLTLILLDGASNLLEAAGFTIALIGLAPVALVIAGMGSSGRASLAMERGPRRRLYTTVATR